MHRVYVPGIKGDTLSHCRHRHLPDRPVLFFRWNNFSHPNMHGTLSRQDCTVATPTMCVLRWISLLQEHLTGSSKSSGARGVTGNTKRVSGPSSRVSRDHRNVVEPFPMGLVPQDCHLEASEGHSFTECLICWRQRSQCVCTSQTRAHCLPTFSDVFCQSSNHDLRSRQPFTKVKHVRFVLRV